MSSRGKRTSLSGLLRQHPAPYQVRQAEGDETNRRFAFSLVDDYGAAAAAAGAAGAAGAASPALTMASTTLEQKRSAAAARTARERQAEQKHYMRSRRAGVDADSPQPGGVLGERTPQDASRQLRTPTQQPTPSPRHGEHQLTHRDSRDQPIGPAQRPLGHAAPAAGRTDGARLAAERDEAVVVPLGAGEPGKAVLGVTAGQIAFDLAPYIGRKRAVHRL